MYHSYPLPLLKFCHPPGHTTGQGALDLSQEDLYLPRKRGNGEQRFLSHSGPLISEPMWIFDKCIVSPSWAAQSLKNPYS